MGSVGRPQPDLDLVARVRFRVAEEQVESSGPWLTPLGVFQDEAVSEAEQARIVSEDRLEPFSLSV